MPRPSATSRPSGAGPKAVSRMSAPAAAAANTPSPNSSRNPAKTDRAASGEGAAVRARTRSTGAPGSARYSSPHSRTRAANRPWAASATWCPACCKRRPRPVNGATSPCEPAVRIRIRIACSGNSLVLGTPGTLDAAVLELPGVVEHVPGAAPDQELQLPGPRRLTRRVMPPDALVDGIAVRLEGVAVLPGVQGDLDADLRRELVDLRAVDVPDDLLALAAASTGALAQLPRDARRDLVERAPARPKQRDLPLALGVGHRLVLRTAPPPRDPVEVGHPGPGELLHHVELAGGPELRAVAGQLGDLGVAGPVGLQDAEHVVTQPGTAIPSGPVEGTRHDPLLLSLLEHHPYGGPHPLSLGAASGETAHAPDPGTSCTSSRRDLRCDPLTPGEGPHGCQSSRSTRTARTSIAGAYAPATAR